jgi:hypothetical protein
MNPFKLAWWIVKWWLTLMATMFIIYGGILAITLVVGIIGNVNAPPDHCWSPAWVDPTQRSDKREEAGYKWTCGKTYRECYFLQQEDFKAGRAASSCIKDRTYRKDT